MSFKVILGMLFALLVGGISVLGIVSYRNNRISLETAHEIQQAHTILEKADEISSLYKDIQLESTAFFIKRDSAVILPYLSARKDIIVRVDELKHFSRSNRQQVVAADSLRALLDRVIRYTDSGLDFQQRYTTDQLDQRIATNFQFRKQIREIIAAIKKEQQRLLVRREHDYSVSIEAFNMTYVLLLTGIALLLAATFFLVRYNFNKRMDAQEAQKKASELFAKIFYESPMGIVISRLESGEIIDCNKSYTELVKFEKSELVGKTAVQLGIIGTTADRIDLIKGIRATGNVKDIEVKLKPKDSEPIWVSISMQTIVINDEVCLLTAMLDKTVHKEAEEKIKQALASEIELNKLKSNFITLASHEFRTPLTTVLSSAALAENYASGENKTKVERHISRIKASVNLLISMLDDFLSVTRIEERTTNVKIEKINLRETIEAQCANLKMFTKPGQEIIFSHSGDEQIFSDPVLLKAILNNLVSNAIKYSGENDRILVSSSVNSKVQLSVTDFGIGISPEDQNHLFERFFRASNTGAIQGTGLGLHIMKNYVDMLHGSIKVKSELGKGSQFEVTFQRHDPDSLDRDY